MEKASGMEVPSRAEFMRTVLLELERVDNHIADVGAIAMDLSLIHI